MYEDAAGVTSQGSFGAVGQQYDLRHQRAPREEIEAVFGNRPIVRTNLRGRVATHLAIGVTDGGRPLTVAFIYYPGTNTAYPVSAWERK